MEDKKKLLYSILFPLGFVALLWAIKIAELTLVLNFSHFGLLPGKVSGLTGILTAPLIHSGFNHLASNSIPLLLLGAGIIYFYPQSSLKVFILVYLVPGVFVWFFGRTAYHIGASGMIYGFVAFLFFSGVKRRDVRSIALALLVTFLYGSTIWGIFPIDSTVSWEYHLFGSLTGIACAFIFSKSDPYKKYDWEDEEDVEDGRNLEISHDREDQFKD